MNTIPFSKFPKELQTLIVNHVDHFEEQRHLLEVNQLSRRHILFNGGYPSKIQNIIIEYPSWLHPNDRFRLYLYYGEKTFFCLTFGEKNLLMMPILWNQECHPISMSNPWNHLKRIKSLRKLKLNLEDLAKNESLNRINEIGAFLSKLQSVCRLTFDGKSQLLNVALANFQAKVTDYLEIGNDIDTSESSEELQETLASLLSVEQIGDTKLVHGNHRSLIPIWDFLSLTSVQMLYNATTKRSNFDVIIKKLLRDGIPSKFSTAIFSNVLKEDEVIDHFESIENLIENFDGFTKISISSEEYNFIIDTFLYQFTIVRYFNVPKTLKATLLTTRDQVEKLTKKTLFKRVENEKICFVMLGEEIGEQSFENRLYFIIINVDNVTE